MIVMAGPVPAIHVLATSQKDVDARDKRGHDERDVRPRYSNPFASIFLSAKYFSAPG